MKRTREAAFATDAGISNNDTSAKKKSSASVVPPQTSKNDEETTSNSSSSSDANPSGKDKSSFVKQKEFHKAISTFQEQWRVNATLKFLSIPLTPFATESEFEEALLLCNHVVAYRRALNFKFDYTYALSSLIAPTSDGPMNLIAELTLPCIVDREILRHVIIRLNGRKSLLKGSRIAGEFVLTKGRKKYTCDVCKQTETNECWKRYEENKAPKPRSSGYEFNTFTPRRWCKSCVLREVRRVLGNNDAEIEQRYKVFHKNFKVGANIFGKGSGGPGSVITSKYLRERFYVQGEPTVVEHIDELVQLGAELGEEFKISSTGPIRSRIEEILKLLTPAYCIEKEYRDAWEKYREDTFGPRPYNW